MTRLIIIGFVLCLLRFTGVGAELEAKVERLDDVSYHPGHPELKLDLYLPVTKDRQERRPAILIVHGGGWHGGDKAAGRERNIGTQLARAGFVCASVNYDLAEREDRFPENLAQVWPRNLQQCMTAVRYLRAHADRHQIDPARIGAIGGSAGGHLVAMLAVADARDGLDPAGPYAGHSCRVQAVVPLYGAHDLPQQAAHRQLTLTAKERELCVAASPITYLDADDPPALILHGTRDRLVPVAQSETLYRAFKRTGVPAHLHVIGGAPHSFHLQPAQRDLRPLVIDFFQEHLHPPEE